MLLIAFSSLINLCYRKRTIKQQWFLHNPGRQPLCIELLLTPYFRLHVPNYTWSHHHPSTMLTWALQGLSFSLGWCTWDPSTSWVQSGFLRPWKGIHVCVCECLQNFRFMVYAQSFMWHTKVSYSHELSKYIYCTSYKQQMILTTTVVVSITLSLFLHVTLSTFSEVC